MEYITIKGFAKASITEKKSEFIGHISPCKTVDEAESFINSIKSEHKKARHNVYAYVLRDKNVLKCSDDGEPSGTGGVPILDLLKKEGITDVCVVVTRYFGGILLGTGGLVRAYTGATKEALAQTEIVTMTLGKEVKIYTDYNHIGKILYELEQKKISPKDSEYTDKIVLTAVVPFELLDGLSNKIVEISCGLNSVEVLGDVYFEKTESCY